MASDKEDSLSRDDYEKRIIRALRQLTQELDSHSRQLLRAHDITMPQVICLDELVEHGAMPVFLLASKIHVSPSTTVGIIDRLEKKGFVTRTRDCSDRRSVLIEITQQGANFIAYTPNLLHNKLHANLAKITAEERIQAAHSLDALLLMMQSG